MSLRLVDFTSLKSCIEVMLWFWVKEEKNSAVEVAETLEAVSKLMHVILLRGLDVSPAAPKSLLTFQSMWLQDLDCIDLAVTDILWHAVLLPNRSSATVITIRWVFFQSYYSHCSSKFPPLAIAPNLQPVSKLESRMVSFYSFSLVLTCFYSFNNRFSPWNAPWCIKRHPWHPFLAIILTC